MDYRFTPEAEALKPSAIREILKLSFAPGVIPFSAGNPAPEAFPAEAVAGITAQILEKTPIAALQYSVTEGFEPLREELLVRAKAKALANERDRILITAGAQQVMSLASAALAGRGDTILCENPSFVGAINAFKLTGARVVGVDMEEDGLNLNKLEDALRREENVKLLYVIPNFQNPTGITTSEEKRRALYRLARQYDFLIIEDDPYGELYFQGAPPCPIKSLDTDGRVIYAGSFSKVLSPGLRVGWCIADEALIAKFTALKQTQDVHTNIMAQMIAHRFLTAYPFEEHLTFLRKLYARKAALCLGEAEKHLAPEITFTRPAGGLFAWCALPEGYDDFPLRALREKQVAVVPGGAFRVQPAEPERCFRINFSTPTDEQIVRGMERLGELKRVMARGR